MAFLQAQHSFLPYLTVCSASCQDIVLQRAPETLHPLETVCDPSVALYKDDTFSLWIIPASVVVVRITQG